MKRATLMLVIAALLLSAASARADLITNGGFEAGNFTGWTVTTGAAFVVSGEFDDFTPHSGAYFAALGNTDGLGYLTQTGRDTAGQSYTLSLYLASDGGIPNEFDIEWDGTPLYNQPDLPTAAGQYDLLSFTVVGTGCDTLSISERNDPGFLALDDISLTATSAVPEPSRAVAVLGMAIIGGMGLCFGSLRKRKPH